MANTPLTMTMVTREAQRILHQKMSFIKTINRQYDDSFAKSGAKIGESLKIRLPNQYTVRTGKTLNTQDTTETSVTLTMATQKGVDLNFSSKELTLDIDDFSKRILDPAMSVLAANIEADVLQGCSKKVYNLVGSAGTTPASMLTFGQARQKLNQYLAPQDKRRRVQVDSETMVTMVDAYKGLFQHNKAISDQYIDGYIDHQGGFDWYENESIYTHTNGSDVTGTLNGAPASGDSTLTITSFSAAPTVGSVFTIAGVYAVHPETKVAYSHLQQFVVTSAATPTTTSITISPAIITTGATQNCSALPASNATLTFVGSASTAYAQNLAYHEDAFSFVTADLMLPGGVDMAAREVYDGISMRIVRAYDINNDNLPCRVDVLYGYEAIRSQLACRITK